MSTEINGLKFQNFYQEGNYLILYRTDNSIKNHFYSKLRKYIRKILKQLNKDNLIKANNINPNKYNSDKIYQIIKKLKIQYSTLNKKSILNLIINYEKNLKNSKTVKITNKNALDSNDSLYTEIFSKDVKYINGIDIKIKDKNSYKLNLRMKHKRNEKKLVNGKIHFKNRK